MAHSAKPFDSVNAVRTWTPASREPYHLAEVFGEDSFGLSQMQDRLAEGTYKQLLATIEHGDKPTAEVADAVAAAMKDWALSRGATHFTHVFQPLTGRTAEKHDTFLKVGRDGRALTEFGGDQLIKGEPDASSFPSGGLRFTHQARGYTAWDPTSPAFILQGESATYLCIPTAFVSWTGDSLDYKTPLLRSIDALDRVTRRALALFGDDTGRVSANLGPEQEYFLIDQEFYYRRPDLINSGRTLFGAKPPKGQELDDHYFGAIQDRMMAYIQSVEADLFRLGVPMQTRHNEVAPQQFEFAPVYENANVAADHQQLMMRIMERNAARYGLVCLLHEKPYARINGSGKHLNWSFGTPSQNLMEPGKSIHENEQFLFFCTAVMRAVERHQDLLLACVASAGNDHRLGANEAPPSIISIFLGDEIQGIFEDIADSGGASAGEGSGVMDLGVSILPDLPKDSGDRNRTSPFAFTGNKFEFRALGSAVSISFPATVLNTIVAESVDELTSAVEAAMAGGSSLSAALGSVLSREVAGFRQILFNGDNYTQEWVEEAARRGLVNSPSGADALPDIVSAKNTALFVKYGVLSEEEVHSRFEVLAEQYVTRITTEGETALSMGRTMILPAAVRYLGQLAAAGGGGAGQAGVSSTAGTVGGLVDELVAALDALDAQLAHEDDGDDMNAHLQHVRHGVMPAMDAVRDAADQLEGVVPTDLWPLPSYRDMIFVR
ncbi:MAG: glutamine synthetase III [Gemmatimonadota bacterium]|nr:glutamine synthetase III [Gemmatimonadota bacterium]